MIDFISSFYNERIEVPNAQLCSLLQSLCSLVVIDFISSFYNERIEVPNARLCSLLQSAVGCTAELELY